MANFETENHWVYDLSYLLNVDLFLKGGVATEATGFHPEEEWRVQSPFSHVGSLGGRDSLTDTKVQVQDD